MNAMVMPENLQQQTPEDSSANRGSPTAPVAHLSPPAFQPPPLIPDHELLRRIGGGSYGEVWLARNVVGTLRAVKIVLRRNFDSDRPYEREYAGIQKFEPVSRTHEGFVDILQIGRNDAAGCFYYVMEVADDAGKNPKPEIRDPKEIRSPKPEASATDAPGVRTSDVGLPSDFGLRNSEFYSPHTLRSEIARRTRLPFDDCVALGLSLARALAHLHAAGLVHRDIKPSNIIFVGGVPKLADIGLVTDVGEARSYVGTEGFIPPEGPGRPAADLFSLGKVLYEMSTGRDRKDYPALPLDWDALDAAEQARLLELNEVLVKVCEADPRRRYQTAEQLREDLEILQRGQSLQRTRAVARRWEHARRAGLAATVSAAAGCLVWLMFNRFNNEAMAPSRATAPVEVNSIAVLPFVNEGDSTAHEYLADALTAETMNALTNLAGLRVAPRAAVLPFKGTNQSPREVGRQLQVRTVLAATLRRGTNDMRLSARLFNAVDGAPLWSATVDRGREELSALGIELVRAVAQQLALSIDERALSQVETNLVRKYRAYRLYSQAQKSSVATTEGVNAGIDLLNRAIFEDPTFAAAYASLAHVYWEAGWLFTPRHSRGEAKKNALRALQLDGSSSLARTILASVLWDHEREFRGAEAEFRAALGDGHGNVNGSATYTGQGMERMCSPRRISSDDHSPSQAR
jgi:TolB-like protein